MYFSLDVRLLSKVLGFHPHLTLADSSYLFVPQSCSMYSILIPATVTCFLTYASLLFISTPSAQSSGSRAQSGVIRQGVTNMFSEGLQANGGGLFFNSNVEISY